MSKAQLEHGLERGDDTELTESERHRLLANERRQVVLDVLPEQTDELTLEELTTAVLERELAGPGEDSPARARTRRHGSRWRCRSTTSTSPCSKTWASSTTTRTAIALRSSSRAPPARPRPLAETATRTGASAQRSR